jgi:hypothetical protein
MSAKAGKGRRSINGAFAWRLIEMLESPANRVLSLSAKRILERLEIELYLHGGKPSENGKLPCPQSENWWRSDLSRSSNRVARATRVTVNRRSTG